MRIFWDHTPSGTGAIYVREGVCEGMRYYTDIKICPTCGQDCSPHQTVRPRWVPHKSEYGRFIPFFMEIPPEGRPLLPGKLVRGKFVRVKDFLTKLVKELRGVHVTATGQPKGFLWVFWRLENWTYLDLSVFYIPKLGVLSRAHWRQSRETSPVGFPHDIVPG